MQRRCGYFGNPYASVWDGEVLGQLLDEDNDADTIWGDSAYRSATIEAVLELMGFESEALPLLR
jgi:hypothetical protein